MSRFVCVCFQSLEKVPMWAKIYCYTKIKFGHKKMQNLLISNPLKRLQKSCHAKKVLNKKVMNNWVFDFKLLCANVFGLYIFCYVFKEFEISIRTCVFWCPYSCFTQNLFARMSSLCKLFIKRTKRLKKTIYVFYNCVSSPSSTHLLCINRDSTDPE